MNRIWVDTYQLPLDVANNRWIDGSLIVSTPHVQVDNDSYLSDPAMYASYGDIRRGRIVYGNDGGGVRLPCRSWTIDPMLNWTLEDCCSCSCATPARTPSGMREFEDESEFRRRLGWEAFKQIRYLDYPRILKSI